MQDGNGSRSLVKLLEFLDYVREKGLMNSETVGGYRVACNKVLEICDREEVQDVTKLDLDKVFLRFGNLSSGKVRPATMKTYKARVQNALSEFAAYNEDPINWVPSVTARGTKSSANTGKRKSKTKEDYKTKDYIEQVNATNVASGKYPFPLRPDVTVEISNLPKDMTVAESMRLSAFIYTLAIDFQPNSAWTGPQLVLPTTTIDG